jgi:hypothetical protein
MKRNPSRSGTGSLTDELAELRRLRCGQAMLFGGR